MDLLIIDNAELVNKHNDLLAQFAKNIYTPSFPDCNEREDFEEILRRTKADYTEILPKTIILLGIDQGEVVGGEIIDLYQECQALEIIYLAVNPDYRGAGIGRKIVIDYTSELLSLLKTTHNIEVRNVYFETNNPLMTPQANDSFNTTDRLAIFSKLGAKWIDIDYVQPALSSNQKEVHNLLLMTFPMLGESHNYIEASSLKSFLELFYKGLGADKTESSLCKMMQQIEQISDSNGFVELKDAPIYERELSECKFSDAIITIHYVTNLKREQLAFERRVCPYFNSYETDLMNYAHQKNMPIGNRFHRRINNVALIYPDVYCYTSEGCLHRMYADKNNRSDVLVDISISYSFIKSSDDVIVHLTLCPSKESYFTEYDLIKLTTLYGSIQEKYTPSAAIKLRVGNTEAICFEEFLSKNFAQADYSPFGTGITQLELSACCYRGESVDVQKFFDVFDSKSKTKFDETTESFSAVICGILLGIFDFRRMTDEEIHDTIRPMVCRDNSFVVMCRGNLAKIECDAEREKADHIIVSPYLLIPSSVLVFNELILQNGDNEATQTLSSSQSIGSLIKVVEHLKKILYENYIVDIFQYRSEMEIVEAGSIQRGLQRDYKQLIHNVDLITSRLTNKKSSRANIIDSVQGALLFCLTITQIKDLFYGLLPERGTNLWFLGILLVLFVCGVVAGRYRQ